jgi:dodecin
MTHIAKVLEVIGNSDKSWQHAAQVALDEAKKTIHGITGVEVGDMTAKVDPNSGKEYLSDFQIQTTNPYNKSIDSC